MVNGDPAGGARCRSVHPPHALADASSSRFPGDRQRGRRDPSRRRGEHRSLAAGGRPIRAPRSSGPEADIETAELPAWQWETLVTKDTRLVAVLSASATVGTIVDVRPITVGARRRWPGDRRPHPAGAPYRLLDIEESGADVVALNAAAWGGPPIGALVFRDPELIETFTTMS